MIEAFKAISRRIQYPQGSKATILPRNIQPIHCVSTISICDCLRSSRGAVSQGAPLQKTYLKK
jgi:hypothetical protein